MTSVPFRLPDGNSVVNRIPPSEIRGVQAGAPCDAVAQYHADHVMEDDITLTVLQWRGNEYDYEYVLLLNVGSPDDINLHTPELVDGAYARGSLVDAIHAFLNNTIDGPGAAAQAVRYALDEPYDSKEEYLDATDKRDQAEWERERQEIHEAAREEWAEEKHSREVLRELERDVLPPQHSVGTVGFLPCQPRC